MAKLLPKKGTAWPKLQEQLAEVKKDDVDWRHGRITGLVYFAGDDVLQVAKDAHAMFFAVNAVGREPFPSMVKLEADIVSMTLDLLRGGEAARGCMSTGGTESIFMASKTARDWARDNHPTRGIPEVIVPTSTHYAFTKAAHYLGLKVIRVPQRPDFRADVDAMADAITSNTIMLVGSAPCYPHGVVDPIGDLGQLAQERGLWLHVDACVGGFLGPFVRQLGYPLPDYDFAVPGVTSISADLHKHGYGAKGASTVSYRSADYFKYQKFEFQWARGRHESNTIAGSRSGGTVAAAWAVINYLGEEGYLRLARDVMQAKRNLIEGINEIEGLETYGDPELSIFTYGSKTLNMPAVADGLADAGWYPNRLNEPPGIHMLLSPTHLPIVEEYLSDLSYTVDQVRAGKRVSRGVEARY